jgi:hypothetical protein
MPDEVHVTTSQADAAKMIVERNSANGKPTPEAIRKIAEAQPESEPAPGPASGPAPGSAGGPPPRRPPSSSARAHRTRWHDSFLARMFSGRATP